MSKVFDVLSLLAVGTIIMVLVRPGSQGPALVNNLTNGIAGIYSVVGGTAAPPGYQLTGWALRQG